MFDFLSFYQQFLLHNSLIVLLLVLSVVVAMQAGLLSLAPVGFMAFGAYVAALADLELGWPILAGIAAAAIGPALLALLFAAPVLRLRGIYFAMGSLALGQAIVVIIGTLDITGGQLGLRGIEVGVEIIQLIVLAILACAALQLIGRSYVGRALSAIRLDERTAEGLGVNVFRYRLIAFVVSAAIAGLCGALEAHSAGSIAPSQFNFELLIVVLTYVLVGGVGHWLGPVLVTAGLILIREWVGLAGSDLENIVYGVLLVATMILAPAGLSDKAILRKVRRTCDRAIRRSFRRVDDEVNA